MKIVLASSNKNKIKEMQTLGRAYLGSDIEIVSLADIGIFDEIEENGSTFEENALIKAKAAAKSGYIGIADDSGLTVDALDGAPGIYSARYSGIHGDDKANNDKLLEALKGESCREASYVCAVACVFPDGREPIVVRGKVDGEILVEPRGTGGFGYDPLFWFDFYGKTFAELDEDEKNAISHRGNAMKLLGKKLAGILDLYRDKS